MSAAARIDVAWGVARSLLTYYGQPWRRGQLKRFYSGLIARGDLVFDIGAHVGSRSKTLLALGAEVVAVEPQPVFADIIEKRLGARLKGFERIAVGAREGEVTLHISSRHPTVTTISDRFIDGVGPVAGFQNVVWDRQIRLPVTTLDRLIDTYGVPAFCKIDVEGAESDILRGLSQPIGLIAFEYIPALPDIGREAIERLKHLGTYGFNRVIGEKHCFVDVEWTDASTMLTRLTALSPESQSGDIYARLMP